MAKRKTDAEFRKEVKALVGDEYTILSKYINARTKIKFKHQKCKRCFNMLPNMFLSGQRCPKCMHNSKTTSEFKLQIKSITQNKYIVLDNYVNSHTKIRFQHRKCGFVFFMSPDHFIRGERCPKCRYKVINAQESKSNAQFKQQFQQLVGDEYLILDKYNGAKNKMKFKHKKCGCIFEMIPDSILRGHRCPKCMLYSYAPKTPKKYKEEFIKVAGNDYILISAYKSRKQKVTVLHKKCGHIYQVLPNHFLEGERCPLCRSSKGEKAVIEYLQEKGYAFQTQFKIKDCKDQNALPFDFAIFNKDKSLNCLIEYQGRQHFINPFSWKYKHGAFNTQSLLNTQKHDAIKLQYCKDHGIKLIRINHPQTSSKSNSIEFIERLVNRTLNKELRVS